MSEQFDGAGAGGEALVGGFLDWLLPQPAGDVPVADAAALAMLEVGLRLIPVDGGALVARQARALGFTTDFAAPGAAAAENGKD